MESIIILVHVLAAIGITGLVLIQHGKGADMGASFGSGASQTMFGSVGSGNALTKSTSVLALIFFVTSLTLALVARQQADLGVQDNSLIENLDRITAEQSAAAAAIPAAADSDIPVLQNNAADSDIPELDALEQTANEANLDSLVNDPELRQAVENALESIQPEGAEEE